MKTVAYSSPFVPPEWIAAHGLRPSWLRLHDSGRPPLVGAMRGVCPYAGALADAALSREGGTCATASPEAAPEDTSFAADAVVLATSCDQMRFVAALLEQHGEVPLFLLNVPSTWQTTAARDLYRDELARLGRFLARLGGEPPSRDRLARVMLDYEAERAERRRRESPPTDKHTPLALLGGPLLERDHAILDVVERAGGRIVLDATEGGVRTLPAAFDPERVALEPLEELADAYFRAIPDVFRRPNDGLYRWLGEQLAACQVRGILLRRYVWCDLWHAESQHLREWSPVPVLEIDSSHDDQSALARTLSRVEAFLETLS